MEDIMSNDSELLGCFISGPTVVYDSDPATKAKAAEQGRLFRSHIWGENGIDGHLKKLKHQDYGKDLILVLFQFYLNPLPIELLKIKEIEAYRKKEKSIGLSIIVTDDNFFNESHESRYRFIKQSILQKIDALAEIIRRKELDTKIELLKADLQNILESKDTITER